MGSQCRPRPTHRPGDGDQPASLLKDGPVPAGRCSLCKKFFRDDVYRFQGRILCGDCRFYVRNGRWPNYDHTPGGNLTTGGDRVADSEATYHGARYYTGE